MAKKETERRDPNMYNDMAKDYGSIHGDKLPENYQGQGNNGRTPINPTAQNPCPFEIETFEGKSTTSRRDPIVQA